MVRKLLIVAAVVLALSLASMFLPAREMNIEGIGQLSFETKITLSVGSEVAYAAPDIITNSPSANSGGWTNPANAYADGGGYASVMSGTPSANHTYYNYGFNISDNNTIGQVRVRYDAWCAGGTANQQRVPTADGGVQGRWDTAPRWDDVDETIPNDADYMTGINTPGGYAYCLFTFSAFSVPAGSTITNLTVYFRARDVGRPRSNNIRSSLNIGGAYHHTVSTSVNPGESFVTYSYAYITNPATGAAWTAADINGTGANPLQQFGVYSTDLNPDIQVSMVYAQVNYGQYDEQIRVDVSWDGGTSWSSRQITTLTGSEATYWYDVTLATSWTPAKLSDANFRVRVDAYTQGTANEVRLDWIPVEVNYTTPGAECWLCGWDKRVRLIIDHNDVDAPLSNFPVLLYLSTSSGRGHDNLSFIFTEVGSNSKKIAVTTSDCAECYVEVEKWDQANQKAWLWVKVPSISNTTNTDLYLYYDGDHADNNAYVGDTDSTAAENVWDSNFVMVQHLGEDATVVHDSTANNNDETNPPPAVPPPNETPPYIRATYTDSGRIDGGYSFTDNGTYGTRLQVSHSTSLNIANNVTLEAFVYLNDKSDSKFIAKDDPFPGGAGCYNLQQETGTLDLQLDLGGWYRASYGTYNTGEWYYLAGTYDRQMMRLYLNGTQVATNPQTNPITTGPVNLALGNRADDAGRDFDLHGLLDEARVSNVTRSAAWIRASHESGIDDLIDFGAEETFPADIVNMPSSINFGFVAENSPYWSNGSAPTFPLSDNQCLFTLTNNSSCPLDVSIKATNFICGGDNWTLVLGIPGTNEARMKAGRSGDNSENDMVILTSGDQSFISSMGVSASKKWEIKLETGAFTDSLQKTSTITLTAISA